LTEILKELKDKGITIKVIGDSKLWLGPKSKLTPGLIARVKRHKAEIIKALQPKPQGKPIEKMTLDEFEKTNIWVKVDSSVLGETVIFASNDEVAKRLKADGFVVYTTDELRVLLKRRPKKDELRKIHEIKQVFPGSKVLQ